VESIGKEVMVKRRRRKRRRWELLSRGDRSKRRRKQIEEEERKEMEHRQGEGGTEMVQEGGSLFGSNKSIEQHRLAAYIQPVSSPPSER
jgi:hypothetical protein